jgi:hypothetical protein
LIDPRAEIARLEACGEAAYAAMYEARRPKDCWDDASTAFRQAIRTAREAALEEEALRLEARLEHIRAVYQNQFRWT